jgi:hypothetical protein
VGWPPPDSAPAKIQLERPLESLPALRPAIENREQEPDFILNAGRTRIEVRRLLKCRERSRGVAASLQGGCAGLDLWQRLLAVRRNERRGQENEPKRTPDQN